MAPKTVIRLIVRVTIDRYRKIWAIFNDCQFPLDRYDQYRIKNKLPRQPGSLIDLLHAFWYIFHLDDRFRLQRVDSIGSQQQLRIAALFETELSSFSTTAAIAKTFFQYERNNL